MTAALVFLASALSSPALLPAAEEGYVSGLNTYPLREIPQFSAEPSTRLEIGEKVQILQEKSGWIEIRAGDKRGWMPESVIGRNAPPSVLLGPLKNRMETMESSMNLLAKENSALQEENAALSEKVSTLESDLEKVRRSASRAKNYQRTWEIALGGGLVIFGWITGYALAAASRRKDSARKYVID